jgi:hypothetical protein
VSLKKVKKHVVKQYNSKKETGLKMYKISNTKWLPELLLNNVYVKKQNKNARKRTRMSLKSLKYLEK